MLHCCRDPSLPLLPQLCELVKFMIEHCQQIVGEDPSSLFGGQPQRLNTDEMGAGTGRGQYGLKYKAESLHLKHVMIVLFQAHCGGVQSQNKENCVSVQKYMRTELYDA